MSNLSFVSLLKSHFYFNVSTGLLFRAVVKQAGDSAVGSGALHPTSATRGMHKRSGLPSAGKGVCVVFKGLKISLDFPACRQAGLVRFFIDGKNKQKHLKKKPAPVTGAGFHQSKKSNEPGLTQMVIEKSLVSGLLRCKRKSKGKHTLRTNGFPFSVTCKPLFSKMRSPSASSSFSLINTSGNSSK